MSTALITGGSRGLGLALATALSERGWHLILDARDGDALRRATEGLPSPVTVVDGDVADPGHRAAIAEIATRTPGGLDLLVNNASLLGPTPLPRLENLDPAELSTVLDANTVAPLALFQLCRDALTRAGGMLVNITSDAAVEAYEGWGGYGASKAALEQLTAVIAVEHPDLSVYAFDPGDMRTDMQQAAFPGEDISDRAEPTSVVPALLHVIGNRPPSGRIVAADLATVAAG